MNPEYRPDTHNPAIQAVRAREKFNDDSKRIENTAISVGVMEQ